MEFSLEFINQVFQMLFSIDGGYDETVRYPLAVFSAASSVIGVVVVLVDWLSTLAGRTSVLKLIYRGPNILGLLALWGIGAGLGGFLGGAFGILELSRVAAITSGLAWPLVLPRLLKSISESEDRQDVNVEESE